MSVYDRDGIVYVKKFCLDREDEKAEYEIILNDNNCSVLRDETFHTKAGITFITVWYEKESN